MTERELERRAKHKLAVLKHVEEVSGSVSATCRYYGISRTCYSKWLKRYEDEGFEGLKADLRRLEKLGKPVVAAITGAAMGGGLEITLACHHRIIADVPGAKVGLPDTKSHAKRTVIARVRFRITRV